MNFFLWCHSYLQKRAKRIFDENPSLFISELFERLDRGMTFKDRDDMDSEYLHELTDGVCEDIPWLLPYKASILNFLTNKVARDLKQ